MRRKAYLESCMLWSRLEEFVELKPMEVEKIFNFLSGYSKNYVERFRINDFVRKEDFRDFIENRVLSSLVSVVGAKYTSNTQDSPEKLKDDLVSALPQDYIGTGDIVKVDQKFDNKAIILREYLESLK